MVLVGGTVKRKVLQCLGSLNASLQAAGAAVGACWCGADLGITSPEPLAASEESAYAPCLIGVNVVVV